MRHAGPDAQDLAARTRPQRPRARALRTAACVLAAALAAPAADATGFVLFQHGGRAAGLVGALTAQADDASAVSYNPAGMVRNGRWEILLGEDFSNPRVDYSSASGSQSPQHVINFTPTFYASWHPGGADGAWAFGVGVDSPYWWVNDWLPVDFPGRFLTRRAEVTLFEVHPTVAYAIDDRWSVGGGLRYVRGNVEDGNTGRYRLPATTGGLLPVEVERIASGDVDGIGGDVAVLFKETAWGWGASLRSNVKLDGSADVKFNIRGGTPSSVQAAYDARFRSTSTDVRWDLPTELRTGFWFAPYPELRIELDGAYAMWSDLRGNTLRLDPDPAAPRLDRPRNWKDVLSIRLGVEGDLGDAWQLRGGVAVEPSPVDSKTLEPGFPLGDAMVYAVGGSYVTRKVTFDLGYSYHVHDDRSARGQEFLSPLRNGTYGASDQVWSASARWTVD